MKSVNSIINIYGDSTRNQLCIHIIHIAFTHNILSIYDDLYSFIHINLSNKIIDEISCLQRFCFAVSYNVCSVISHDDSLLIDRGESPTP